LKTTLTTWEKLLQAEKKVLASRWHRILSSPGTYMITMAFNKVVYPLTKKEWFKKVTPFFGVPMTIALPSGTDILFHGIKAHDSEIRLSKFLTHELKPAAVFIDVGAHHGYYSLLASAKVGGDGKVLAVEASQHSFDLLQQNTSGHDNIRIFHNAAGEEAGEIVFYEYPGPYAEYNTIIKGAYDHAKWKNKVKETVTRVNTITLEEIINENKINHALIKIDVEGGEYAVLKGMGQKLQQGNFTIIMEYLYSEDSKNTHHQATHFLMQNGYACYSINASGETEMIDRIDDYMMSKSLTSDNLVFHKSPLSNRKTEV